MFKKLIEFLEDVDEALEEVTADLRRDFAEFLDHLKKEIEPEEEEKNESNEADDSGILEL